ncbi:MAG: ScyD/ScyE family protein [Thermomicrobiales bacterium]
MKRLMTLAAVLATTLGLFAGAGAVSVASAQDATPVTDLPDGATVVASGLTSPRGFTWAEDGTLYVALAGSGGANPATEEAPTTQAIGPWQGGPTAAVARIENGCPVAVATGLPSAEAAIGDILGADDVAMLGGDLYAAVDGGGAVHGNPDQPSGVYRVSEDGGGGVEVVADLSAWVRANPVAEIPGDHDPDSGAYRLVADEGAGLLWAVDPNNGQILTIAPDGTITRVADLSAEHPVPSAIALAPNGGVFVGNLTALPYTDGTAKVIHVAPDGTVTDVWTGLTAVTDVAVSPDGTLYASELSTGNLQEAPFLVPGSGRVVRQTGPDTLENVASGLMLPIALDFSPDGDLYVALPALGADRGEGAIVRLDLMGVPGSPAASGSDDTPACSPIPQTLESPHAEATPVAELDEHEAAA